MEIDIRDKLPELLKKIHFDDACHVEQVSDVLIGIEDDRGWKTEISKESIDNLIKALQKAKEVWG